MLNAYDWLIRGGRVIDPANHVDEVRDVAVRGETIAAVTPGIDPASSVQVYDATGQLVIPGLVDLHVHVYDQVTPVGISPDHYCLGRGVTTAVDAGSAGACTLAGFQRFIIPNSRTRLLAFLNISTAGLAFAGLGGDSAAAGELETMKLVSIRACVECAEVNRDTIVGIKVRLSDSIADNGKNEAEAFRHAMEAARLAGLPLMTHHAFSTVPLDLCPLAMQPGDIYTHMYHGFASTIINPKSRRVDRAVLKAREKGVLFDIGHGQGSFSWTVAELASRSGFWPDTISTDLHSGTCEGPAYDLPTVMSRLLSLGMPLTEVIRSATLAPAAAIAWGNRIGTLGVGREADIAVLSLDEVAMELEDSQSQMRSIHQLLTPRAVWRAGVRGEITRPRQFPNAAMIASQRVWLSRLAISDGNGSASAPD